LVLIDKYVIHSHNKIESDVHTYDVKKEKGIPIIGFTKSSNRVGIDLDRVNLRRIPNRTDRSPISLSVDRSQEPNSSETLSIVYTSGSSYYSDLSTIDRSVGRFSDGSDADDTHIVKNRTRHLSDSSDTDESI
jgi:hypothetical protein